MDIPTYHLNEDNFIIYAAQNYNKKCLDIKEFYDDILHFKYLKKLFKRYQTKDDLQERLILNHIIIVHNIFTIEAATKMCFYKIPESQWPILKTFLLYLNLVPTNSFTDIAVDLHIVKKLQHI